MLEARMHRSRRRSFADLRQTIYNQEANRKMREPKTSKMEVKDPSDGEDFGGKIVPCDHIADF